MMDKKSVAVRLEKDANKMEELLSKYENGDNGALRDATTLFAKSLDDM